MGAATDYLVVKNLYRYRDPALLPVKGSCEGYLRLAVTYEGTKVKPKWHSSTQAELVSLLRKRMPRHRLRQKGPMPSLAQLADTGG
jgi:hypothetical protein